MAAAGDRVVTIFGGKAFRVAPNCEASSSARILRLDCCKPPDRSRSLLGVMIRTRDQSRSTLDERSVAAACGAVNAVSLCGECSYLFNELLGNE